MAQQQEEGWPLGLHPLTVRVGLPPRTISPDFSGSISFNTLISASPSSSSDSSSALDTESTGSFFHDKSITLGRLIGISNVLEITRRSDRRLQTEETAKDKKSSSKSKTWFYSLCSRNSSTDVVQNVQNAPSLAHFLEVERRAANDYRMSFTDPPIYGRPIAESNSLFVDGCIAPPRLETSSDFESCRNGVFFSCICGQPSY